MDRWIDRHDHPYMDSFHAHCAKNALMGGEHILVVIVCDPSKDSQPQLGLWHEGRNHCPNIYHVSITMSNWLDDHHSFSLHHHVQRQPDHECNHPIHLMLKFMMCRIGKNSQPIAQSSIHSRLLQCTLNTACIFTFVTRQYRYHRTKNMGWTFTCTDGVPHTNE
jgi:hypothetical protein